MKDTAVRPERVEELSKEMSVALSKDLQSLRSINMKTRLLSINAQIEAARAGEAGLAFAVVAGEVMELARNMDSSFHNLESETAPLLNELEELGARLAKDVKGQRLADLAATHLDLIDRNLYERTCDVRWWATDGGLVKAMETRSPEDLLYASQRMGTILDSYTVYFDLVLCDMDGMVVANGRPHENHSVGTDMSRQEWFLSGKKTMDGSEYGFEGVHKTVLAGGEKVLVYSTAVRADGQENGRPIGVLGVVFRWDALGQTIVENAAIPKEEMDHTRVLILEPDGRVIAANDGSRDDEKLPLQNWLVKDTTSARYHFTHEWRGTPAIISVARSQGYETYSTGWVSVIIQKIETLNSFSNSSSLSTSYSSASSIGSSKHSFIGV